MTRAEWLAIVERDEETKRNSSMWGLPGGTIHDRYLLIEAVRELLKAVRPVEGALVRFAHS